MRDINYDDDDFLPPEDLSGRTHPWNAEKYGLQMHGLAREEYDGYEEWAEEEGEGESVTDAAPRREPRIVSSTDQPHDALEDKILRAIDAERAAEDAREFRLEEERKAAELETIRQVRAAKRRFAQREAERLARERRGI